MKQIKWRWRSSSTGTRTSLKDLGFEHGVGIVAEPVRGQVQGCNNRTELGVEELECVPVIERRSDLRRSCRLGNGLQECQLETLDVRWRLSALRRLRPEISPSARLSAGTWASIASVNVPLCRRISLTMSSINRSLGISVLRRARISSAWRKMALGRAWERIRGCISVRRRCFAGSSKA